MRTAATYRIWGIDVAYQRQGIGNQLVAETQSAAGERALLMLILMLIAAPAAEVYYSKIGRQQIKAPG